MTSAGMVPVAGRVVVNSRSPGGIARVRVVSDRGGREVVLEALEYELVIVGVMVGCLPVSLMESDSIVSEEEMKDGTSEEVISAVDEFAAPISSDDEGP